MIPAVRGSSLSNSGEHLFVYGTLRPGFSHPMADFLAANAVRSSAARMRGRLYHLGSYPGFCPCRDVHWVKGDLFRLPEEPLRQKLLAILDDYESEEYRRTRRFAWTEKSLPLRCWVYVWLGDPALAVEIESGDFLNADS